MRDPQAVQSVGAFSGVGSEQLLPELPLCWSCPGITGPGGRSEVSVPVPGVITGVTAVLGLSRGCPGAVGG